MIDLDAIRARLPRWGNDDYLALIGEVERLRTLAFQAESLDVEEVYHGGREDGEAAERAAVVAWLRDQAYLTLYESAPVDIAAAIERGEHVKGDK